MYFFDHHHKLFGTAFILFAGLSFVVAIGPALYNQNNNEVLPFAPTPTEAERLGKNLYIANGCVACHTQQVRNIEMDKVWGDRPNIPADYAMNSRIDLWRNTATLMGTERTGPDLTNIGIRQSSVDWNLLHLFQPRAVVPESIMPAYPWLFKVKKNLGPQDKEVVVPEDFRKGIEGKIVASQEALNLVAYLQSLKQVPLLSSNKAPDFLYQKKGTAGASGAKTSPLMQGKLLYAKNCQSCHQSNGEGLKGAFPPLKGSAIVMGNDLKLYVTIIMKGYDARPEYAVMNAVGEENNFTAEDVAAIINYERNSWGNKEKEVTVEEVKKIMDSLK